VSAEPELATLHHYHIVGLALQRFDECLQSPQREELLAMLKKELVKPEDEGKG
jgi:hypothetical protein